MRTSILRSRLLLSLLLGFGLVAEAHAQSVPSVLHQEGLLIDAASGNPLAGPVTLRFSLFPAAMGGVAGWTEQYANVALVEGYYSVLLGSQVPLTETLVRNNQNLEVQIGAVVLSPRTRLVAVPFALVAQALRGGPVDATTVAIGGVPIINAQGQWVGNPTGLQGPAGVAGAAGPAGPAGPAGGVGANGSADTPAQVLDKVRQVDGPASDLNADLLDGISSAGFIQVGAAIDATSLGGQPAANYLRTAVQVLAILAPADGPNSGLDADRLDGLDSSQFVTTGPQALALIQGVDGVNSGLDADRLDGIDSAAFFQPAAANASATIMNIVKAADGSGSGVDTDLLDGLDSTKFMRTDENTGTSGLISVNGVDIHVGEMAGAGRAWMVDGVRVGASGSDGAYFGMKDEGDNNADAVVAWGDDPGDDLRFIFTRSGGPADGEEYMRIVANGNVGIGKPAPDHKVHVAGTVGATALNLEPLAQPPANPTRGHMYLDTASLKLKVYDGSRWNNLGASGAPNIAFGMWNDLADGGDNGTRLPYSVSYTKQEAGTRLWLQFSSNLRTHGGAGSCCRWALRVNGAQCDVPVNGNVYINPAGNYHHHTTINGICNNVPAGNVNVESFIELCPGYGAADCYTGWNSMTALIVREVPAAENISFARVENMNDGADATSALPISTVINKQAAGSLLELTYAASMRIHGADGGCCRWGVRVDGNQCNVPVNGNVYTSPAGDPHHIRTIQGVCAGVAAGNHTIQPYVEQCPGYGNYDCYTGWQSTSLLAAREIPVGSRYAYGMWAGGERGEDATQPVPGYSVAYTKQEAGTALRLTYSANLRTHGGDGSCCRWALRVNGNNCPIPVNGNVYISPGGNYHWHRTITGMCTGVAAGNITVQPWLELCPGYGAHDCYTGWNSMSSIIVEEGPIF